MGVEADALSALLRSVPRRRALGLGLLPVAAPVSHRGDQSRPARQLRGARSDEVKPAEAKPAEVKPVEVRPVR